MRIGIIGVGGAGRAHALRFLANPAVSRVVGFDIKPIAFDRIDIAYEFESFIDRVDAVSICTPDDTHGHYIVESLDRGKHVLVEKPMVASFTEARAIGPCITRNEHLVLAIHHQMRFVPAFAYAKDLLRERALGRVFYAEANYWHDMRARNIQFDDWRVKGKGQSVIFGGACHPLDLLMYLMESEVESHTTYVNKNAYTAYPATYTAATTILRFRNGVIAKTHTNNCATYPQLNDLVVMGDTGTYVDGVLFEGRFANVSGRNVVRRFGRIPGAGWLSDALGGIAARIPGFRRNPFSVYDHDHACRVIVDDFVRCVKAGGRPLVGYEDGCRVIRLCEALERDGAERMRGTEVFASV